MNIFTIYNLETGEIDHSPSTVAQINEVGLLEGCIIKRIRLDTTK